MLQQNNGPTAKPDVKRAVEKLLVADANFDRYENRTAHRKNLVRPVHIELRETGESVQAFSRNISSTGIGLITHQPLDPNLIAVLSVMSLEGENVEFLAESRWCKSFGDQWFFSGWQFVCLKR